MENENPKKITFTVTRNFFDLINRSSHALMISKSQFIRDAIREYIEKINNANVS